MLALLVVFFLPDFCGSLSGKEDPENIGLVYEQDGELGADLSGRYGRYLHMTARKTRMDAIASRKRPDRWKDHRNVQSNSSCPISRASLTMATPAFCRSENHIREE